MVTADFHTHSYFSGDSTTPTEEQIKKAISLGLDYICLTEHYDMYTKTSCPQNVPYKLDTKKYFEELTELKEKYAKNINVRIGVEISMRNDCIDFQHKCVNEAPFDFVIGSSHVANSGREPYFKEYFEGRTEHEAYLEYFYTVEENAKRIDDFDVYGHVDYVTRYCSDKTKPYDVSLYIDIFDRIFKSLISKGKGIEINTSAWTCGLPYAHPRIELLKLYRSLGGEIVTVGSDAHNSNDIGQHFARATDLLTESGFKYYTVFKDRKPEFIKL